MTLTLISSIGALQAQTDDWLPSPAGPYDVGTTTYHWVDALRDETFTDDPNDKRELVVQIWYPADIEDSATPIPCFRNGEANVRGFLISHQFDEIVGAAPFAGFAQTPTQRFLDAPVSNDQPRYPVLISACNSAYLTPNLQPGST